MRVRIVPYPKLGLLWYSKEMKKIVVIIWTLFLLGVLLAPIGEVDISTTKGFEHFDKVAHFCLFTVTGFIGVFGANFGSQFKSRVLFGAVFGLFLALSTELGQSLLPFRDMSLYDLIVDVVGVGVGLAFYAFLYSRYIMRSFFRL